MVRRPKKELLLQTFKWPGRLRERGSDTNWFPVEYLAYLNHNGKRRSFTVRRNDGGEYLTAIMFFKTNSVNEPSDGWKGKRLRLENNRLYTQLASTRSQWIAERFGPGNVAGVDPVRINSGNSSA